MCRGVTFCLEMRQVDFTGGAQQPLTVVGIGNREKSEQGLSARVGELEGILAMDIVHAEEGEINPS